MRTAHRLLSAWNVFLLFGMGGMGVFALFLSLSSIHRFQFVHWLVQAERELLLAGGLIILLAVLLIVITMRLDHRQYYQVKMGFYGLAVEVDLDVVRTLAGRYWQTHFPSSNAQVDALLRSDQTLELFVELPLLPQEEQEAVLQKIEVDLGRQLARHLGYRKPFLLTVSASVASLR
ncbi:MAG: hypothetical protein KGZ30_03420 [Anaplasmataceae bacterium]|nr:hypothetical protein [Anaplasmataceae bacterium]